MVKISAVAHKIKMAFYANSQSGDLNFERSFVIGWCSYSRDSQTQDEAVMKCWFIGLQVVQNRASSWNFRNVSIKFAPFESACFFIFFFFFFFLNRIQGICHLLRSHNSTQLPLSI